VEFGFASHDDEDEICVTKYKILKIFAKNVNKYSKVFYENKFPLEKKIKTVWDNFSENNGGTLTSVEVDGETFFDVVENLKELGLYFSHTIEE